MLRFGTHTRERRYDPVPGVRILEREAPHKAMTRAGHEPIEVVDFFSGCGGASAGLREAGMRIRLGIDHDEQAGATYRRNFPEAGFIRRDIRRIATCELEPYIHRPRPLLFTAMRPVPAIFKTEQRTLGVGRESDAAGRLHQVCSAISSRLSFS